MYGQSVPHKTVRNMTTKDNPINLYAADSLTVQPLDFTVLSETAVTPVTHMETTETLYKLSYTVCVKADSNESHQLFISLSARECECRYKRVKAEVFIQDPFNPVLFTEDSERYVDVSNIVCALTSYNCSEDILEFEEGDVFLLLGVLQHIYQ